MIRNLLAAAAVTFALTTPAKTAAQPNSFFATPAMSDQALAGVCGTASPYASLSRGNLVRLADEQSRSSFRIGGSIAGLQMEVWWGTIGSELIANAIRNRL